MMHLKQFTLTAATLLSVAVVAGCGGAGTASQSSDLEPAATALGSEENATQMDDLYTAAQESGETTVVTYGPGEQLYSTAYEVFMKRYPDVQVTGEYIYGAELSTRLDQEFSSGQRVGSIQTGGPAITNETSAAGRCAAYDPFTAADMEGEYPESEDGTYRSVVGYPQGIAYNTDITSEDQLPTRFLDITDPAYQGKFTLEAPNTTNGTTNSLAQLYAAEQIDEQWLTSLAGNSPEIRASGALSVQAVVTGEAEFEPFAQYVMYKQSIDDGLPVGFYFPLEGSRVEFHDSCILQDAPSADATQLLYNWLFTPEGQQALTTAGVYGVRPGTPAPDNLPELSEAMADPIPSVPVPQAGEATRNLIGVTKTIFP